MWKPAMPPTTTEVMMARVAVKSARKLGIEVDERTMTIATWPEEDRSPESEWPTLGR